MTALTPFSGGYLNREPVSKLATTATLKTFIEYAKDAENWGGLPYVSEGNIACTKQMRGHLSHLVQAGLITIHDDGLSNYIQFTDAGKVLAKDFGITVED